MNKLKFILLLLLVNLFLTITIAAQETTIVLNHSFVKNQQGDTLEGYDVVVDNMNNLTDSKVINLAKIKASSDKKKTDNIQITKTISDCFKQCDSEKRQYLVKKNDLTITVNVYKKGIQNIGTLENNNTDEIEILNVDKYSELPLYVVLVLLIIPLLILLYFVSNSSKILNSIFKMLTSQST